MTDERNVLGGPLEPCGTEPMTGFFRDGCCATGPEDVGSHTVFFCEVIATAFNEEADGLIYFDRTYHRVQRHGQTA